MTTNEQGSSETPQPLACSISEWLEGDRSSVLRSWPDKTYERHDRPARVVGQRLGGLIARDLAIPIV